jgi:hypothetical protein
VSETADPAGDGVTVEFTRDQVQALFGLLRQASQHSYGLLITDGVRDAWVQLSAADACHQGDTVGFRGHRLAADQAAMEAAAPARPSARPPEDGEHLF